MTPSGAGAHPVPEPEPSAEAEPEPGRDPGLQPERTRLAWRRTTLSAAVVALLAARQVLRDGATPVGLMAVGLSLLVWIGFLAVAHRRMRSLTAPRPRPLSPRGALLAAGCVVAFAGFAVAVVL